MSLKQIQITTYQITKEFIMKEKINKRGGGILCILGMTSPIKFETICVFLNAIEVFSQLNYLQKAWKPPDGNGKNYCDHLQKILTNATMEKKLYIVREFPQSSKTRQLFNNMFEKGAIPLINRPTRVTTSGATL